METLAEGRLTPCRPDGHAHIERQRQVFQVAETGKERIADDSLGPVPEDVSGQLHDGVDAQERDEGRQQAEGPVRVKAAVADFAVPLDVPHQDAGDQVTAQHEEHNDPDDARALEARANGRALAVGLPPPTENLRERSGFKFLRLGVDEIGIEFGE